jgi:hypothetical protein
VAGSCECGNECSGSIKCKEFLDYVRTGRFSRRTLLHVVNQSVTQLVSQSFSQSEDLELGKLTG